MGPRPRPRRALSNRGGPIALRGDSDAARLLQAAWRAAEAEPFAEDALTHGFHSYPARMHPALARALIAGLSQPGGRVLDPFCGSGTVLIEAMRLGRTAVGVDLSPLAVRVAEVGCELRSPAERQRFELALQQVAAASLSRVRARTKARAPLSAAQRATYEPHVLLELAGLLEEIRRVQPEADARALELVFSTLLVKFSRTRADTAARPADKRIRKGLASEFFLRKGQELVHRWEALVAALPGAGRGSGPDAGPRTPRAVLGDARELPRLLAGEPPFALVVSSPPYGGTYDYQAHHALRCAWLGLPTRAAERGEIGARRHLSRGAGPARAALARWDRELGAALRAIGAVCEPDASIALVMGDAQIAGVRIDAAEQLARLAPQAGLRPLAVASQPRADYHRGPARMEHIVLMQPCHDRAGWHPETGLSD